MYIVIEKQHDNWDYAIVVTDEQGNNKVFDTLKEAQAEANDCQNGIIVGDDPVNYTEISRKDVATSIGEAILGLIEYFKSFK